MGKKEKYIIKACVAIIISIVLSLSNIALDVRVNAGDKLEEAVTYEYVINEVQRLIHGQSNKQAVESLMMSFDENERQDIIEIYNNHISNSNDYFAICSLLEEKDFHGIKTYVKENVSLTEFDMLLVIYFNHSYSIKDFMNLYANSDEMNEMQETSDMEQTIETDYSLEEIEEEIEEIVSEKELVHKELSETVNGTIISISGNLPENTELVVAEIESSDGIKNSIEGSLNNIATVTVYRSFEITLIKNGEEYEPEYDNSNVDVSIQCEDNIEDNWTVFHTDDNNNTNEISSTINTENNTVEFTTESFSVYTIASVEYDTDNGSELSNDYATAYYFEDIKTLLVTSMGADTGISNYPWYSIKDNIEHVVISSNCEKVGKNSFFGYSTIKTAIIEQGIVTINACAFYNCTSLQEISLPEGITTIGDYAFGYCSSLQSIVLSKGLVTIGAYAFEYCSQITEIVIPEGVETIYYQCFYYSNKLKHIVLPESLKSFPSNSSGYRAFYGITSITGIYPISLGKGTGLEYGWTEKIPANAFQEMTGLKEVIILDGITTIGNYAFYSDKNIKEIILPDTVTTLGSQAFGYCSSLSHVVVPESCNTFLKDWSGLCAFYKCTSLTSASPISSNKGTGYEYGWTEKIPANAFHYLSNLTSVEFLSSIKSIGNYAFSNCSSLQQIILPEELTTIGAYAFEYNRKLVNITAYRNITAIGGYAFYLSSALNTQVYTNNKVVKNYSWSGDKRNVTFYVLDEAVDIDITISTELMNFSIDGAGNFTSDDTTITNNTIVPININIINIEKEGTAPDLVESTLYDDWSQVNGLEEIALMINNNDLNTVYDNSEYNSDKFISLGTINDKDSIDNNQIILKITAKYGNIGILSEEKCFKYNMILEFSI